MRMNHWGLETAGVGSRLLPVLSAVLAACALPAQAADWEISGLVRQDIAVKTTDDQSGANQAGIPTNGVAVSNTGLGAAGTPFLTRPSALGEKASLNQLTTRVEVNVDGTLTETLKAHIKLRAVSEQVGAADKAFEGVNFFKQEFGGTGGGPLSYASKKSMVDLPAFYLDYNNGPLWLRAGNQQIAWGEALFFRVADVPNGLDYRRHLFDVAAEEYSDVRRPALGLRANWRASDTFNVEGFGQKFEPSLLFGTNSPYNIVPAQFIVQQQSGYDERKDKWNFGLRARGDFEGIGWQAFASSRHNPEGVYKWSTSQGPGAVAGTPFTLGTGIGVYSAKEWFNSASLARLDGVAALDSALNEFVSSSALAGTAAGVASACGAPSATVGNFRNNAASASCVLDTFFDPAVGFGNLRGSITRTYPYENVFGFGLNHIFEGAPDTLMDQLIGRFEISYTPNKKFTNPSLSANYIVKNETQFAFITEKYHKFSSEFPATYFVAQWLHKTASDIFGRALEGVNNTPGSSPTGQSGGFNAVALAVQQPSPTLAFRFDLAVLTDLKGGWYMQPGVRWKPSKSVQGDLYANVFTSRSNSRDFADGLQNANEIFARLSFFF